MRCAGYLWPKDRERRRFTGRRRFSWITIFAALTLWGGGGAAAAEPCVVLLHGLARSATSMWLLELRLQDEGFHTVNESYPSTTTPLRELFETVPPPSIAKCEGRRPIHFVTHSMGGVIMRGYLAKHRVEGLGRLVLLAPPNKGSELVDTLKDVPGFEWLSGPAGIALSADIDSIPNTISDADAEYGVIAGDLSLNPLYSSLIPGDDDGKVSVESTKFAAMTDHIVVNASHTFIMNSSDVAEQVIAFLRTGRFLRPVD